MKKKGFTLLAAIICVTIALAGCSSANNNSADNKANNQASSNNGGSSSENSGEKKPATTNDKEFTIRIGGWFLDDRPHQQGLMKAVEEGYKTLYPNAKIQWDITLGAAYFDKLKAQFASDSAPDVVFYQGTDYVKNDLLMELSNESFASRLKESSRLNAAVLKEGKLFGIPMQATITGGVWYNKDLFDQLKLQPPKTTQEFLELGEKINAAGKTPIALGFKDQWTVGLFLHNWIQSYAFTDNSNYGKEIYDGVRKMDDPAILSVIGNLQTMKEKGYFNKNALSIDWPQSSQMFSSGEAAMIVQGPWMPGAHADNVAKNGYANFQIGFFPFMDDQGKYGLMTNSDSFLGINAKTKLVQESKDLINLMTSAEILAPWLAGDGMNSSFKDVNVQFENPVMGEVKQYLDQGVVLPYRLDSYLPASAKNAMIDTVTKVVSGINFNPDDLKAAQTALEKDKTTVVLPPQ